MKIELIRHLFDNGKDIAYKYKPFDYCCKELRESKVIKLTDNSCENAHHCDYDEYQRPIPTIAVHLLEVVNKYGEEWENNFYYKINYCPFCGKPIDITVVEEKDLSDIYNELQILIDKKRKEYSNSDSIKERDGLIRLVCELNDKINWFYELYKWDGSIDSVGIKNK